MPEWGMLPIPKKLLAQGVRDMVRISDARMSGTSYGACVLHVAPESFVGGPLALRARRRHHRARRRRAPAVAESERRGVRAAAGRHGSRARRPTRADTASSIARHVTQANGAATSISSKARPRSRIPRFTERYLRRGRGALWLHAARLSQHGIGARPGRRTDPISVPHRNPGRPGQGRQQSGSASASSAPAAGRAD